MKVVRVVGVVVLPGPHEARWRSALLLAAKAKGWTVTKRDLQIVEAGAGQLTFLREVDDAFLERADDLIVISSNVDDVYATALRRHENDDIRPALRRASGLFATACRLIDRGAIVIEGGALEAEAPGLGSLRRAPAEEVVAAAPDLTNPLAIYNTLPPAPGASALWSTTVFSYTQRSEPDGGTPEINLCGGTRVLVQGPYFHLPVGRWRVTARFTIEPEDDAYLIFEWGAGADVATCYGAFHHAGSYEVVMDHVWVETGAAELRVWAERAHLFGKMTWLDCRVERLADELAG